MTSNRFIDNRHCNKLIQNSLFGFVCLAFAVFLSACVQTRTGRYVAPKVQDWKRWERNGVNYYTYPSSKALKFFISLGGSEPGRIAVAIGTESDDKAGFYEMMKLSQGPIRIVFHDYGKELLLPAKNLSTDHFQKLDVGNSADFSVTIPSLKIGEEIIPPLTVRVHWTEREYKVWGDQRLR